MSAGKREPQPSGSRRAATVLKKLWSHQSWPRTHSSLPTWRPTGAMLHLRTPARLGRVEAPGSGSNALIAGAERSSVEPGQRLLGLATDERTRVVKAALQRVAGPGGAQPAEGRDRVALHVLVVEELHEGID